MDLTFQVPMQYCSLQHGTLLPSQVTSTAGCCFCFGSISLFFLELFLYWSPVAYWTPTDLGSSSFSVLYFAFHTVQEILKAGILKWFAIPFSSGEKCGPLTKCGPLETVEGDSGKPHLWSSCCPVYQVFCSLISLYFLESQEPAQNPTGEIVSP